ncbi:protein SON isoform X2 [Oryzias latipes]|uniref:protein SON isoform X2 n=1 Tax=Oryzias latipes TaxID=8090 RepID=UPI000CE1637C|nr:protein SON isoform X2 [Oryzias latipes]
MAANIEQIFQDFILKKIREIEDQSEDPAGTEEGNRGDGEGAKADGAPLAPEQQSSPPKKQKKHKKHRSKKKKKKNRGERSSSESGTDPERNRKLTSSSEKKEAGEDHGGKSSRRKQHSTRKKKKKKKRGSDSSSDSDSELALKQEAFEKGRSLAVALPDIIPKQDSFSKGKRSEERVGRSSRSPASICPQVLSCSRKRTPEPRSRSGSRSGPECHLTGSSSSEKRKEQDLQGSSASLEQLPPAHENAKGAEEEGSGRRTAELPAVEKETEKQDSERAPEPEALQSRPPESSRSSSSAAKRQTKKRRNRSPQRSSEGGTSKRHKKSRSPRRGSRKRSKRRSRSRSPSVRRRSRSKSPSGKRRSRSRSAERRRRSRSRSRRRVGYSQRDRWKREPSRSPVVILRRNRSPAHKERSCSKSPKRISELDKEQLLEIAKANAAAMCVKAGMPVPASLRTTALPLTLPSVAMNAAMASMTAATVTAALSNMGTLSSLLSLQSIANRPQMLGPGQCAAAALEEAKKKVAKQANTLSIKEFTDKCRMIVDSSGELPVAVPHVSDEEDETKPLAAIREQKVINININNATLRPTVRSDAGMAKEFPVSSGSQHRKKEGDGLSAYGEWVEVERKTEKATAAPKKPPGNVPPVKSSSTPGDPAAVPPDAEQAARSVESDSVFPEIPAQPVDITQAVAERIKAQKRLAENPNDISAMCMLSRAQEQAADVRWYQAATVQCQSQLLNARRTPGVTVADQKSQSQMDAWAQSSSVPGLFTGSTGAQVLSSEELSSSGPQAWLKKDQFLRAAPVSGGVGEFLMRKMGWKTGEGLGRNREGTVDPIVIDFKVDRKGLVAEGEKPQKQTGGLVVTKDLMGKHPVSALIELCNKRRIVQPDFVLVHHSGPDHRKNFLFKVTVDGVDFQPQTASPNKKHAKAMAATVALQALGEVSADGPGLYTGPVFTAASTGPLFST